MWEGAELSIKGGIARAYKTPNLYQSNPNYLLYSRGNGCNASEANMGGCYLVGNRDLKPEISVNKEIGLVLDKGTSSSLSGSLVVESSPPLHATLAFIAGLRFRLGQLQVRALATCHHR